jgi:hypothetical protein
MAMTTAHNQIYHSCMAAITAGPATANYTSDAAVAVPVVSSTSNPEGPVFLALCFAARKLERFIPLEVIIEPPFSYSNIEFTASNSVNCWQLAPL